jgi:hypothetical protein
MNENYENFTDEELYRVMKETKQEITKLHNKQMSIKILKHS